MLQMWGGTIADCKFLPSQKRHNAITRCHKVVIDLEMREMEELP